MRKPRYYYESNFYHVMVQGDEKKFIFKSKGNKDRMLFLLKKNAERNDIQIVAYCLMDNHIHILVYAPILSKLSKMMSQCNTSFGIYYSKKRKTVGHVFRDRFKSENIYTKEHLLNCIKYIHENPVKANICRKAANYYYSSYNNFRDIFQQIKDVCGFDENDYENIVKDVHTITRFIEDEYSKEDIEKVFNEIWLKYKKIADERTRCVSIYYALKNECRIANVTQIAKFLGINRTTLNYWIKKDVDNYLSRRDVPI